MKRFLDLSTLSVPQLLEMRKIIVGNVATSEMETKAGKLARALRAENEELKREKKYKGIVESYDLDFDDEPDYWLSFNETHLRITCRNITEAKRWAAQAEKHDIEVPPLFNGAELSGIDFVRQTLNDRKNGKDL